MGGPSAFVCCAGAAVRDRKLHLLGPPVPGTSNPARAAGADGGVARNVAEALGRLGVPVRLVSRVGDDATGAELLRRLAAAGVDIGPVRVAPGLTGEYVALLDPAGDLLYGASAMDLVDRIDAADLDRGWPEPAGSWLFLDCNLAAATLGYGLARARDAGLPVAVDAVSTPKVRGLPADLTGIEVLFCNRDEAAAYLAGPGGGPWRAGPGGGPWRAGPGGGPWRAGSDASDAALALALRAAGAAGVVLTRGVGGVLVTDRDGQHQVAALPAVTVDVTGAGDALVAGTLTGLLAGQPLRQAAELGTAAAALTVESEHTVRPDLSAALVARAAGRA
jgi:pseudouridine kinase